MGALFLVVCCGICGLGFVLGFVVAIVQYFQIRKIQEKLNALRHEVGEIEGVDVPKEELANKKREKSKRTVTNGTKRVTFKDESATEREVAGQNNVESVDKNFVFLQADIRLLAKFVENYNASLKASPLPVSTDLLPNFVFNRFYSDPPVDPPSLDDLLYLISSQLLPRLTHWQHPHYFGPNGSGRSAPDVAAHLLYPHIDNFAYVKRNSLRCLYSVMKIPIEFKHRMMVESENEALVHVFLAARNKLNNTNLGKMVAYSFEANSSIVKSARIVMMRLRKYSSIEHLEERMKEDVGQGLIPSLIVVRAGEESAVFPFSEKYSCWLHMDAAQVGLTWLTQQLSPDVNVVDSFFLEMPYVSDLKIVWSRHEWTSPRLTRNCHIGYVKLYTVLSTIGLEDMQKRRVWLEDVAKKLADVIGSYKQMEIVSGPAPTTTGYSFRFQYKISGMDQNEICVYTSRLHGFLQNFVFGSAELSDQTRAIVVNVGPSDMIRTDQLEEICSQLRRLFDEFELKKDEMLLMVPSALDCTLASCSQMSSLQFDLTTSEE